MKPANDDTIKSVEKAIDILFALNANSVSSLDLLYKQTKIPKPTISRFLKTFEKKGMIKKHSRYGYYILDVGINSLNSGYHQTPKLVHVAQPIIDDLTQEIKWPLNVALYDIDAMIVRCSSIHLTPLSLVHSSIDMRLSIVARALGRAWLAYCENDVQDYLFDILRSSNNPEDHILIGDDSLKTELQHTKKEGYALRHPSLSGKSNTIAVPIFQDNQQVIGSLGMTWISSGMSVDKAISLYLKRIRDCADLITNSMKQ